MITHLGQTILFYPGSAKNQIPLGTDPIPAIVTAVHSQDCVNLELLIGPTKGLGFSSVTHEVMPEGHSHFCWHQKEVLEA